MKKNILLAMLMVAFVAVPAFASVQNVKVSGSVDTTLVSRSDFNLGVPTDDDAYQNLLITQTRLRVDADLTDKVGATIALLNERAWDEDGDSEDNDFDVNLAFISLKEILGSNASAYIGRQTFHYGNSFIIDAEGTNNSIGAGGLNSVAEDLSQRTALDAARFVFDLNPLTIDLVAAKIDANDLAASGTAVDVDDDVDLFGTNLNYQLGDEMGTEVEGYFWARLDQSVNTGVGDKSDSTYVPGVRISTNPIEGLNTQIEFALQRGNDNIGTTNIQRSAQAGQFIANYKLPVAEEYKPVAQFVYTYVSGDSDPGCTDVANCNAQNAWDPMLENQSGGKIFNALFNLTNAHIYEASIQGSPMEDLTAKLYWDGIWLDKEINDTAGTRTLSIVQPDGGTLTTTATDSKQLGYEIGADLTYAYTEDVQFGIKAGAFVPGKTFDGANEKVAKQLLANIDLNF